MPARSCATGMACYAAAAIPARTETLRRGRFRRAHRGALKRCTGAEASPCGTSASVGGLARRFGHDIEQFARLLVAHAHAHQDIRSVHALPVIGAIPFVGRRDDGAVEIEAPVDTRRAAEGYEVRGEVALSASADRPRGDGRVAPSLTESASSVWKPFSVITSVTTSETEMPAWNPMLAVARV